MKTISVDITEKRVYNKTHTLGFPDTMTDKQIDKIILKIDKLKSPDQINALLNKYGIHYIEDDNLQQPFKYKFDVLSYDYYDFNYLALDLDKKDEDKEDEYSDADTDTDTDNNCDGICCSCNNYLMCTD